MNSSDEREMTAAEYRGAIPEPADKANAYYRCDNCFDWAGVTPGCEGCLEFLMEHSEFQKLQQELDDTEERADTLASRLAAVERERAELIAMFEAEGYQVTCGDGGTIYHPDGLRQYAATPQAEAGTVLPGGSANLSGSMSYG